MAKILYEVKKNMNSKSRAYNKWFARSKSIDTLKPDEEGGAVNEGRKTLTKNINEKHALGL